MGVLAIEMGIKAKDLALTIHPHPTLSETLMEAADVFYHLLMYLEANDVKIEEVMQELEKRKK